MQHSRNERGAFARISWPATNLLKRLKRAHHPSSLQYVKSYHSLRRPNLQTLQKDQGNLSQFLKILATNLIRTWAVGAHRVGRPT